MNNEIENLPRLIVVRVTGAEGLEAYYLPETEYAWLVEELRSRQITLAEEQ